MNDTSNKIKLWYTSVNPTMLSSGWVKQAAGMLKWLSTWSFPVTCSTTVRQFFHQMILLHKLNFGKVTSVTTYLKFLVHWQHEQASSCHLHHQYSINEAPIIPHPMSVTISQGGIIITWEVETNQLAICIDYSHALIHRNKTTLCYHINL